MILYIFDDFSKQKMTDYKNEIRFM